MTLVAFLLVCVAGLFVTLLAAPHARLGRLAALVCLALALGSALLMNPDDTATVGEVQLQCTPFAEDFLAALAASALLLCLVGLFTGWADRLAPAALAVLAGVGVAITATDPTVALAAAAAGTTPAALVASRVRSTPLGQTVGTAELRTLALVIAASLLAAMTILNTNWSSEDPTFVLALTFVVLAAAVAVRSGVFPFHVPAALLSRSGEGLGLVLSLVWVPAGFALVALSWNASIFGVPGDWLDRGVAAVQVVAVATLILGAVGAMLHDEVEEVAVYSVVQDAGFILLALTARTGDAAAPARLWLASFVVAKSALVAWAAALSWSFNSSNLGQLRGWLRRSPMLGLALGVIVLATLGLPGSAVFEARATLVELGLPEPLHFVGTAAILLALAYYGRLAAVGLLAPAEGVRSAASGWLQWPRLPGLPEAPAGDDETPARGEAVATAETATTTAEAAGTADAAATTAEAARTPAPTSVKPLNLAEMGPPKPAQDVPEVAEAHRVRNLQVRRHVIAAWHLNRPLEAGSTVLVIAALAAGIALGGFAVADAATQGIALDQAAGLVPTPGTESGVDTGPVETPEAEVTPSLEPGSETAPSSAAPASSLETTAGPTPAPTDSAVTPSSSAASAVPTATDAGS
jgi:NADH:ubiquinone oxidoreductase subunit 2 (subunit N)